MLLVDSSVWIDQLRGNTTEATRFIDARDALEDLAITAVIYQEVLQGATSDRQFQRLRNMLDAMPVLEPDSIATYAEAAGLYRAARTQGFTIRKSYDCLIAAIALEYGAVLVHNDRDFLALNKVEPRLQVYPGSAESIRH